MLFVTAFPDSESFVRFNENIRGTDVFLVQSTSSPANHNVMELLIMIDAAKRASAARVTAVLPFFGYARQDRKDQPRVPITSKLSGQFAGSRWGKPCINHGLACPADSRIFRYSS